MKKEDLIKDINTIKEDLNIAHNGYQYANTKDEIDYYTYTIKALQCKFSNVLNKVRVLENIIIK